MKQLTQEEMEKKIDEILKKMDADTLMPIIQPQPLKKPPTPEKLVKIIGKLKGKRNYDAIMFDLSQIDEEGVFLDIYSEDKLDKIADTLMDISLRCNIETIELDIDGTLGTVFVSIVESDDGTTNITADVIQAFMNMAQGFSI